MSLYARLISYHPNGGPEDWEVTLIQHAILELQMRGWTDNEIVGKLRWLEHVDPNADEATALRNMKRMDELVAIRQASIKS